MLHFARMVLFVWPAAACLDSPGPPTNLIDGAVSEPDAGDSSGETEWQIPFGISTPIVAIADDRIVVTAGFVGTVPLDPPVTGNEPFSDVLLAGFEADGELRFADAYGGAAAEFPGALTVSPTTGDIAVTGVYSDGEGNLGGSTMPAPVEGVAMFAARYDQLGNHVGSVPAVSTRPVNAPSALSMSGSGAVVVTGDYVAELEVGTELASFIGPDPDIYLALLSSSGNALSVDGYGNSGVQTGEGALHDGLGGLYLFGTLTSGFAIQGKTAATDGDDEAALFVCRLEEDLSRAHWMFGSRGGPITWLRGAVTPDGSLLLAGAFEGSLLIDTDGSFGLNSRGGSDVFIALIGSDGRVAWIEQFGGVGDDEPRAIAIGPDNHIAVTGTFRGKASLRDEVPLLNSNGNGDIFVLSFDGDLSLRWARGFGDGDSDVGVSVAVDSAGAVVVGAVYRGEVDFGGPEPLDSGAADAGVLLRFR